MSRYPTSVVSATNSALVVRQRTERCVSTILGKRKKERKKDSILIISIKPFSKKERKFDD